RLHARDGDIQDPGIDFRYDERLRWSSVRRRRGASADCLRGGGLVPVATGVAHRSGHYTSERLKSAVRTPIDNACDPVFDEHHVEVDQQAKSLAFVGK